MLTQNNYKTILMWNTWYVFFIHLASSMLVPYSTLGIRIASIQGHSNDRASSAKKNPILLHNPTNKCKLL